jgi:DNA-cytosine methyltransferase
MNVLSLFDGMSCGQIALNRAGIKYEKYYAAEIDKHAIEVALDNYPETIQLGDVSEITKENLPKIDLLIGGSPCQGFSMMGSKLNFDDDRSKLFFEYLRLLNELKPKYFLLENVRMKTEIKDAISKHLGVDPILINSTLVSAQSRNRLYWTNIPNVSIPIDKNIEMSQIIQNNVDEKYFLKGKRLENWNKNAEYRLKKKFSTLDSKKASCMTARQFANWYGNHVTENGRVRQLTPIECERLQTVPDNYSKIASDSQRFKMLGNGWTIDVISHIFKNIK